MNNNIPDSCSSSRGPGQREESECPICTSTIEGNTKIVTHLECRRCLLGVQATQVRTPGQALNYLTQHQRRQEVRESAFEIRLQAAIVQRTGTDVANMIERFDRDCGDEWLAARPNIVQNVQDAIEERSAVRRERIAEQLRDDIAEQRDEMRRQERPSRRRNGEERRDREARNARGAAREEAMSDEFFEIYMSFME